MQCLLHRNVVKSRWVGGPTDGRCGRFIAFLERLIAPRKSPVIYQHPSAPCGAWEMRRLHTKSNWGGLRMLILNPRGKDVE